MYQATYQSMQISARVEYTSLESKVYNCESCGDHTHVEIFKSSKKEVYASASKLESITYFSPTAYGSKAISGPDVSTVAGSIGPTFTSYAQKLGNYFAGSNNQEYHAFEPFLKTYRPETQFIGAVEEVESFIKEAFEATTGDTLPPDILIHILSKEKLKAAHQAFGSNWNDAIQGFAVNGPERKVFIKQNDLDKVMLVAGHEIGHVLTKSLSNAHDEEAKAFAFELAWMEAIVENNIADLKENITLDNMQPANNGLHNIAFNFVKKMMNTGKRAVDVLEKIVKKEISVLEE
jgi:hypothetical protein